MRLAWPGFVYEPARERQLGTEQRGERGVGVFFHVIGRGRGGNNTERGRGGRTHVEEVMSGRNG